MGRTRVLVLVLLVVIIGAIAAVFLLGGGNKGSDTGGGAAAQTTPRAPTTPTEIPPTPVPTQALTDIVVAKTTILRGMIIRPEDVELRPWPVEALPGSAVTLPEDVIGFRARTDIDVGQPILSSMAVEDLTALAAIGSDLALLIPPGRVAIAVPVDRITSVAGGIQPGDYVDVIVSLLYVEIDSEFQSRLPNNISLISFTIDPESGNILLTYSGEIDGRVESTQIPLGVVNPATYTASTFYIEWPILESPSEDPRPRLVTNRTIQNALVLYLGDLPEDGRIFRANTPTPAPTATLDATAAQQRTTQQDAQAAVPLPTERPASTLVTLAVTPQEAVVITYMIESHIPITFALRSATDTSEVPTERVTLEYISSRYHVEDPGRQEVAIEPAIRSIRQLMVENTISFGE